MANSYFTLTNSDLSLSKKFGVIQSGYEPMLEKMQSIQTTLNGGLDVSYGGIYETHSYTIRIRETETRFGYGSKADLETFYRLNNPNLVPSPVITLTDHFGVSHECLMVGNYLPVPVGVMIEGDQSWMIIKCVFKFIPAEGYGGS